MPSPVVYFTIGTPDLERAREFYRAVFDWRIEDGAGAIDPLGPGDFDVKGSFRALPEGSAPAVTLFFRVSDLWASVEKAQALGAELVVPIRQTEAGAHIALVRAPDGQSVGIVQA
jgi:uncharacterized protein